MHYSLNWENETALYRQWFVIYRFWLYFWIWILYFSFRSFIIKDWSTYIKYLLVLIDFVMYQLYI